MTFYEYCIAGRKNEVKNVQEVSFFFFLCVESFANNGPRTISKRNVATLKHLSFPPARGMKMLSIRIFSSSPTRRRNEYLSSAYLLPDLEIIFCSLGRNYLFVFDFAGVTGPFISNI